MENCPARIGGKKLPVRTRKGREGEHWLRQVSTAGALLIDCMPAPQGPQSANSGPVPRKERKEGILFELPRAG